MSNGYTPDHVNVGGASLLALKGVQKRRFCFHPAACHTICTSRNAVILKERLCVLVLEACTS